MFVLAQTTANRLAFGLPRTVWLVQAGMLVNTLGWGAVLPFEVIYLHDGRGFSLPVAGVVIGFLTGMALIGALVAGPAIDRFGARATAIAGGLALAAGYGGLASARSPLTAAIVATLAGLGNGALNPSQSSLMAALPPPQLRHRAVALSRVSTNLGFGLGGVLGGLVATHGLPGLVALFWLNALTYLVWVATIAVIVREPPQPIGPRRGYRTVLRDRALLHLALTNVAIIGVGWGVFSWVLPPFARQSLGLDTRLIGGLALANALTVVVAQVPVARWAEGRRRVRLMAGGAGLFSAACTVVAVSGVLPAMPYLALVVAAVAVGLGECLHTSALMPLVADLAPVESRGVYMATMGLSWWLALALAPALGVAGLGYWPAGVFWIACALAAAAAVSVLLLERRLPAAVRLTPEPI